MGRKPFEDRGLVRSEVIQIRVTVDEKDRFARSAEQAGQSQSDYGRDLLVAGMTHDSGEEATDDQG